MIWIHYKNLVRIDQIYDHLNGQKTLYWLPNPVNHDWPWRRGLTIKTIFNNLLTSKNNGQQLQFRSRRVTRTDWPTDFLFMNFGALDAAWCRKWCQWHYQTLEYNHLYQWSTKSMSDHLPSGVNRQFFFLDAQTRLTTTDSQNKTGGRLPHSMLTSIHLTLDLYRLWMSM